MIAAIIALSVASAVTPIVLAVLVFRHQRFLYSQNNRLADSNQQLVAALMMTKNTPYAASSASYAATTPDEEVGPEYGLGEFSKEYSPVIPEGTKLLGT